MGVNIDPTGRTLALDRVELIGPRQNQPCGKGADDESGAGHCGHRRQAEDERYGRDQQHVANPHPDDEIEEVRRDEPPRQDGDDQEADRDGKDAQDAQGRDGRSGRQSRHHRQNHQAKNIVYDGGADDDPRLQRIHSPEVRSEPAP